MGLSVKSAAVLLILSGEVFRRSKDKSSRNQAFGADERSHYNPKVSKNQSLGGDKTHILLTKRTENMRHHAGEVAFPGGMREECDKSLFDTALREAEEEIALNRKDVKLISQLAPSRTRQGINVHPYVVRAEQDLHYLRPDQQEIASLKWVDIDVLREDRRLHTDVFDISGEEYWAPVYKIDDYYIWGFTSRLLVNYLNYSMGANIQRQHKAPEKRIRPS